MPVDPSTAPPVSGDPPPSSDGSAAQAITAVVAPNPNPSRRRRTLGTVAAFIVGILLFAAAVCVVWHEGNLFRQGLAAISAAPAWAIALALGLYLLNFVFASASFWVLTNRYGPVRYFEMFGLIAGATLLNYLPLRPGMLARVGYHKIVNGIAVRDSLKVLFRALACAGAAMVLLLSAAWGAHTLALGTVAAIGLLGAPLLLSLVAAGALAASPRAGHLWRWPAAASFRYLDMCAWTARYALIFWLLGRPMDPPAAAAVAFSSQAAMISPVQLGLREWVVGTATGVLESSRASGGIDLPGSLAALAPGLLADIMSRAAELVIAVPLGLIFLPLLSMRARRRHAAGRALANDNSATRPNREPTPTL